MDAHYRNYRNDALSDVLDALQVEGQLYCITELTAPWAVREIAAAQIFFYVIERGGGWIKLKSADRSVRLASGDLILIPHGDEHVISDDPKTKPVEMSKLLGDKSPVEHILKYGGGGSLTNFVCGSFHFNGAAKNMLIESLPRLLHISAHDHKISRWLEPMLRMLSFEVRNPQAGSSSIISRVTGIIFVQAIRIWIETQTNEKSGWLAALGDEQLAQALNLLHQKPAENWTVAKIATAVGMSRSPFAAKFSALVGEPPLRYLKRWRMNLALNYLQNAKSSVGEIAVKTGYASEAAFSKAFKRYFGDSPRKFRKR